MAIQYLPCYTLKLIFVAYTTLALQHGIRYVSAHFTRFGNFIDDTKTRTVHHPLLQAYNWFVWCDIVTLKMVTVKCVHVKSVCIT